jgi:hypothetical protein
VELWVEIAKAIPSVVTAIAAVAGVIIAARGLSKWRAETIGKRKGTRSPPPYERPSLVLD